MSSTRTPMTHSAILTKRSGRGLTHLERWFAAGHPREDEHYSLVIPAMDTPDSNDSGKSNNMELELEEYPLTFDEVAGIRPVGQLRQAEVETISNRDSTSNVTGGLRSSTCFVKATLEIW
ncbi:hypothetical protein E4U39_007818 [Claviceps sp. Clav50 group G5]|nr:hypothetical protein E4U39_007818 [Claviceps sp. Clav50 group G5]